MFRYFFIAIMLITGVSTAQDVKVVYSYFVEINGLHCSVSLNQINLVDTRDFAAIPESMTFSDSKSEFVQKGENYIGLKVSDVDSWKGNTKPQYCKVLIRASVDGIDGSREITSITIEKDKDGKFITTNSTQYPIPNLTGQIESETLGTKYIKDAKENDFFARRIFKVDHPHYNLWATGEIIIDSVENRKMIWEAQNEFRRILASQDYKKYKEYMTPAIRSMGIYNGWKGNDFVDHIMKALDMENLFKAKDFQLQPINALDYKIVYEGNGKIVTIRQNDDQGTPAKVKMNGEIEDFNIRFSLINGKFIPTLP